MSLFRGKEWWTSQLPDTTDNITQGSMCFGNLLPAKNEGSQPTTQIVVGSASGYLSIYSPMGNDFDIDKPSIQYQPEHLLHEDKLSSPIVCVRCGMFSPITTQTLAVLHPKKLVVYRVFRIEDQVSKEILYSHELECCATRLLAGSFGGIPQTSHYLCVQQTDCRMSFYEQENFAFTRKIPDIVIPGPIAYVQELDCFVMCSSGFELRSYQYQSLAIAGTDSSVTWYESTDPSSARPGSKTKRLSPTWCLSLNEFPLAMQSTDVSPVIPSLLVLTHRHVWCISQAGALRYMKRLDCDPRSLHVYSSSPEGWIKYIVTTEHSTALVLFDDTIKWSCKLATVPISLQVCNFGYTRGIVTFIGEDGRLHCNYIGTDPTFFGLSQRQPKPIDYDEKQVEIARLQEEIAAKEQSSGAREFPTQQDVLKDTNKKGLRIHAKAHNVFDLYDEDGDTQVYCTVKVTLDVLTSKPIETVTVHAHCEAPVKCEQAYFSFLTLSNSHVIEIALSTDKQCADCPSDPFMQIYVSYSLPDGAAMVASTRCTLPLDLFASITDVLKSSDQTSVTIVSSGATKLSSVFSSFTGVTEESSGQSLGFRIRSSPNVVSVLLSKSSPPRYRIQSTDQYSIALLLEHLILRIGASLKLSFTEPIPLKSYIAALDKYAELSSKKKKLESSLEQKCAQLRAIEKTILARVSDPKPSPLSHMIVYLEATHGQLISQVAAMSDLQVSIRRTLSCIRASIRTVQCLLRLKSGDITRVELMSAFHDQTHETDDLTYSDRSFISLGEYVRSHNINTGIDTDISEGISNRSASKLRKLVSAILAQHEGTSSKPVSEPIIKKPGLKKIEESLSFQNDISDRESDTSARSGENVVNGNVE